MGYLMSVQTRIIVHQWIEEVWNKGKVSLLYEMHSEDYVHHELYSRTPTEKEINYLVEWVTDIHNAFPDLHVTANDVIAEENKVACDQRFNSHPIPAI